MNYLTTESDQILDYYLKKIITAKVYEVAKVTDLQKSIHLSDRWNNDIFYKREDQQEVFSFKIRGAYNKISQLSVDSCAQGVVCASAGNHAQGVAWATKKKGIQAYVVMPSTTPKVKIDAVKALGADVRLVGTSYTDAYYFAKQLAEEKNIPFIHPFDDEDVIAGQGTVAMEILQQYSGSLDAVFVPVGGGGLISGVALFIKAVNPKIKVVGVQMTDSDAMFRSVDAGQRVELTHVGLFSDGTAVKLVGEKTFDLVRRFVDEIMIVDTDAVCAAMKDIFLDTRNLVEPAGALALAGLKKFVQHTQCIGKTLVAINSGANTNFERLRFVAERSVVGEEHEAFFVVTIPEQKGSFLKLCQVLNQMPHTVQRQVTEFNYRIQDNTHAHVLLGLSIFEKGESQFITDYLQSFGFGTQDMTYDELTRTHLRHLMGGNSILAKGEKLFRILFPERPLALLTFLQTLPAHWNISLFHYRYQGMDEGSILIGLQSEAFADREFVDTFEALQYPWTDETPNSVYQLFLKSH
ncbi:MAG: threonine ammonia-lyase, biosynthetic [Gammaproteobacteria bacterium]|nr:threonine ammonia-lyase, biosynthetic [Gammaproteobacteria bacterium]